MGKRRGAYKAFVGKPEENNHLEELGVDGRILKTDLKDVVWGGMDWTDVAQNRNTWRSLVNSVMDFCVQKIRRISSLAENRLAS